MWLALVQWAAGEARAYAEPSSVALLGTSRRNGSQNHYDQDILFPIQSYLNH